MQPGQPPSLKERFQACMIIGAIGDALGYNNGSWEFNTSGPSIHEEVASQGGFLALTQQGRIVSDDTVMHVATLQGIVDAGIRCRSDPGRAYLPIAKAYKECMDDMMGRAPGGTCMRYARMLEPGREDGYVVPFNSRGGGCGASMRSMVIGLFYPFEEDEENLINLSIESGRMTHNTPRGYLGSLVSALFTAYAIRKVPPIEWGRKLMEVLPRAKEYVLNVGRDVEDNKEFWHEFEESWEKYLKDRKIDADQKEPTFPEPYGVPERDEYYTSLSPSGWGGSCGDDSTIIAYDAFLGAKGDYVELANRAFFHGGDSDSTAIIAGCWYGAWYGFKDVPENHLQGLDKKQEIESLTDKFYNMMPKEVLKRLD